MKLSLTDPETDMEMDMTPMIDVVFNLIIFFMIITDMSQQELEDLVLPTAVVAQEDKPDPDDKRAIVNVLSDGTVVVKRDVLYDPADPDNYDALLQYLAEKAKRMRTAPFNDDGTGPLIPDDSILIRADQSTPFEYIQKIMELCGRKGVQIWKLELAAAEVQET